MKLLQTEIQELKQKDERKGGQTRWESYLTNWQTMEIPVSIRFICRGIKRQKTVDFNPYKIDITEIEGFDNLHHAEGVLLEAQKKAEKLYGSEESHFLINGSNGGHLKCCFCMCEKDRSDCT